MGAAAHRLELLPFHRPAALEGRVTWRVDAQPVEKLSQPLPENSGAPQSGPSSVPLEGLLAAMSVLISSFQATATAISEQTGAIAQQAEAINRLANSNALLSQAIMETVPTDEEEAPGETYLDGSAAPRRAPSTLDKNR
jgi:hypothetical protein